MKAIFQILFMLIISLSCGVVDKMNNKAPIINGVYALRNQLAALDTTTVWVDAEDPDDDKLSYSWNCDNYGHFSSTVGQSVVWTAPELSGNYNIFAKVRDEDGDDDQKYVTITVVGDETPVVQISNPKDQAIIPGKGVLTIKADAQHKLGIGRVEFYIDNILAASDLQAPYSYNWPLDSISGEFKINVKGFRLRGLGNPGEDSVRVTIEGISKWPL